jgi:hypothetical protein
VGRDAEIAEVIERLALTPLTTVTGPGGVGKTSLALNRSRSGGAPVGRRGASDQVVRRSTALAVVDVAWQAAL